MLRGLRCVRCGGRTSLGAGTVGCARCRARGVPSALLAEHDLSGFDGGQLWERWSHRRPGVWAHEELLPVRAEDAITLVEGGTPLFELPSLAAGFHVKDERRNPTGSFKDRFFSTAVSWARQAGASTIAVASSGNAGVSAAAYAAAAGLEAVVITTENIGNTWRGLVELHGGRLVFATTAEERWQILREHAEEWTVLTNTSQPPVSSLWVGIEGYKTLAYEIVRELGESPEAVAVPVSRGDALAGAWAGFRELRELGLVRGLPRMIAVERFPSLGRALADGSELPAASAPDGPVEATSIGDPRATAMALQVLRESDGTAVTCSDADLRAAARRLGQVGLGVELSSAAGLVALDELRRRSWLGAGDRVVSLLTSHAANQPETLPG